MRRRRGRSTSSNRRVNGELKGGSARMRELGYRLVQVWLDPRELEAVQRMFPGEKVASLLRRLVCEATLIRFTSR